MKLEKLNQNFISFANDKSKVKKWYEYMRYIVIIYASVVTCIMLGLFIGNADLSNPLVNISETVLAIIAIIMYIMFKILKEWKS